MSRPSRKTFTRYLTEVEERRLFATVKQASGLYAQRDFNWMRLMRNTGLRVGTVRRLTVGMAMMMLRSDRLQIPAAIMKGEYSTIDRMLTREVKACISGLLTVRREMGLPMRDEDMLVGSRKGGGLSERGFQDRMQHWRERAGLTCDASPHWFRHTLAKRIMKSSNADNPRAVVADVLGHTDLRSTDFYTWPDREEVERAVSDVQV